MTLREIYRAGITFWFGNHYKLDAYVLRDGKKHPFALICPGGAYMLVSEENEGHTFAAELNRRGISAFVLHYRCRRKGRYPAPQQDVARALHEILAQADALHLDADNYSLWGSSAGGHLAPALPRMKWALALWSAAARCAGAVLSGCHDGCLRAQAKPAESAWTASVGRSGAADECRKPYNP